MEDKRDILYKNLLGSGRVSENEIGTLDQFKSAIKDEGTARQFHKNLLGAGFTSDEIGSDDDFYNSISSDFDPKHDTVMAHSVNPNWEQGVVPAVAASKTENKPAITSVDNKTAAPVHQEVFGQSINPEWNQHILSPYTGKKEMEDFSDKPTFQTYDNVRDYYAGKFSMTEEGKAAQGEIAEIEKDLVDTMIGRMKQSDEYKAIIASDAAPGDKDKTLQAIWERDYQPEVDKFMQPFINEYGEKILNRYGQSMQGDYHQLDKDNASASWEGINNRIEQVEAELDKTNGGWKNVGRPTFESAVSKNERETASQVRNEKVRQISAARSMMERSQKMIQAANDNKDGTFVGGVARGFRDETFNLDNWTFGVKGMRDGKACMDAMEKYERGEKLTKEEEILMDALASEAATQAYFSSDLGRGYKYGAVTGASLPFMLDMMTGMGLVSGATKAASKGLMKWIAKKGLQAGAKKTLTKGGLGLAKGITDSAIHTATFGSARVGENYLDRANGNAKFDIDNEGNVHYAGREGMETGAGALGKAFASTALETQSELIGAQFGPALNFVGKQMMRIPGIRNIPASKIGKLAKEYSGSAAGKMLKDFTSKTQFHGMLGEYAEEVYNNIGSTLLGDMTPEQLVSLDQNLDTFLSVSVMSAAFGTIGTGAFIRERYKNRKAMRDFEKVMRDNMDYDAIKAALKDADIEGAKAFIKEVMSDKSLSPEERKEEIEYIVDVLKESVMGSAEQEIGKEPLSEEEIEANKAAIVTEFEQARKNLESAVPPEILSMVDAGQDISSMPMSEEQEMAFADYIAAKSGMDDYMNSVDNKVTEAKMEARREVEGVSNPDMGAVVRVTRRGSDVPINIVGGKITFDEEGLIDKENSDDIIYYVDENGKRKQGTPGDFEKLVDSTDTEAVAQQAEADAEQQVLDEEQAQLPQPYMPQPGEEVVLPNGYRGTVAGMQDSETVIVSNGESTVAARLDEVQPANQAQPVIESPVSSTQQAQPVEEKAESVTDSAQEPEQPAEETKPTAMPMIGEGEDMEPDFKSVDPQRTYDYLYGEEGGLTPEEASAFVDANIAEKQKAVEKFSSKAPKMGTSLVKYRKAQAEWKAQAEAAQKELDYWNSVKSKRDEVKAAEAEEARKVKAGEEVASVVREMGEPMNGEELAATMLANGAINLRRDEFTKETGYGNAEASKLFGLFRTKDNGGVSLQEAGELVMQADREAGTNFFDQNDPNAGRNAILDVLASSTTPSDLRNFIKNNREAQAKKEEQAERDYFDSVIQSSFHMSLEEFELYQERLMANNPFEGVDLKELDAIFAEDYINRLNVEQNGQGNIEPVAGSPAVLPGTQAGDTGTVATGNEERQAGRNGEAYAGHAPTLEGTAGTGPQGELDSDGRRLARRNKIQASLGTRYLLSEEQANNGEVFYQNQDGSTILAEIPDEIFDKIGLKPVPFKLTETMGYHVYDHHKKEAKFQNIDDAIEFVLSVINNVDHVRLGRDNSYIFSVEDGRNKLGRRAITIMVNSQTGQFMGIRTSGYETIENLKKRPLLWMRGTLAASEDVATPTITTIESQQGDETSSRTKSQSNESLLNAETLGTATGSSIDVSTSKDSNNDSKKQEPKAITTNNQGGILDIATTIAKEQDRQDVRDQVNTEPSDAQKEAGNYKMGHLKVDGLDVSIENPKGSTRSGKDANGTEWSVTMNNDYGYIRRTEGADGDHVDVFLSDNPEQGDVFIVDQVKSDGSFDEHKVMYGFNSEEEARAAYLANYSPGWNGLGAITRTSKEEFKEWVKDGEKKSVPFSGNKSLSNSLYNEGESLSLQGKEGAYEQGKVDGISGEGSGIDNSDAATEILRQTGRRTAAKNGQTGRKKESILGELAEKTSGSPYWINDVQSMVSSPIGKGGENEVYLSSDGSHVIKVNDFSYLPNDSTNFDSFLNRVEAHNELFPNDAISVIGFTNNSEGRTSVVLMQPYVHAVREAKQEEIDNFLEEMDFYTDMSGDWTDGRFDIADTRPENVLVDANGLLHFVDVLPFDSKRNGKMLEIPKKREAFTEKKSVPFATLVDEELEKQLGKPKKAFFNLKPTSDEEKKQRKDAERRARIDELFKKEKEAFANEDGHNSYAEGLRESKTWQEAVSFFRKKKSELEAEAKDWSGRKYKKNGGSVLVRSDEDMDGWEEKSVDGINERRRRNAIHAALKRAQEFEEFAQTLMSRIGASETKGDETKSSEAYSITPAQYTTKKGKVLDMQLVTPASQLDKEQVKQATKFAKDKRGWYDFAKGGFMVRSEEDAKEMASFIEKMNAPEKKENIKTPENQTYNEPEDTETLEETEPEVQASQLSTWKADATPINTDGSYDIILDGEQEHITITKDFGNGVFVADAVNSQGERHQFIGITEEQIRKGIALMLDKVESDSNSGNDSKHAKPASEKTFTQNEDIIQLAERIAKDAEEKERKQAGFAGKTHNEGIESVSLEQWKQMDGDARMQEAGKHPLLREEIEKASTDDVLKANALDYLNGNQGMIQSVSYLKVYEDVRYSNRTAAADSGATDSAQLDSSALGNEQRMDVQNRGESGGSNERVDREIGGERVSAEKGSLHVNPSDAGSVTSGNGNGGSEPVSVRESVLQPGYSRSDVSSGGSVRGGKGRNVGGRTGRTSDRTSRENSKRGVLSDTARNEENDRGLDTGDLLDNEIADAMKEFDSVLDEFKRAGKEELSISLVGMSSRQMEVLPRLIAAGAKVGYAYVKKGVHNFAEWAKQMRKVLGVKLNEAGLSDKEIDAFIAEMWKSKLPIDGETHTLEEWASILGKSELRKKVGESLEEKRRAQLEAEHVAVKVCDLENIADTLPFLLPQQQEDVMKAEMQFFDESHNDRDHAFGKGYMFTNGTGTGKTYTGLGIVKRFVKQGKGRVLVLTPSQTKVKDWVNDAKNLGIELHDLDAAAKAKKDGSTATTEKGEGAVITTYANFRQNKALLEDLFDLIVYDESHRLLENKEGTGTAGSLQHYKLSNRNEQYAYLRLQEIDPTWNALNAKMDEFNTERGKLIERLKKEYGITNELALGQRGELPPVFNGNWMGTTEQKFPKLAKLRNEVKTLDAKYNKDVKPELERQAKANMKHTKVVFLSATPFNTRENLDYAEGYIFSYPEQDKPMGFANQSPRSQFYLEHFGAGYRWRYNRLESSINNPEAVAKQEVEFSEYLQHTLQTMSGRIIDSPYDYSRDFPTVTMEKAEAFNTAMEELSRDESTRAGYSEVMGDYNYSSALFESMKVSQIIPRLKAHLERGRKVVVFHRRVDSREPLRHPFAAIFAESAKAAEDEYDAQKKAEKKKRIASLKRKYAELLAWEQGLDLRMPREQLADAFGKDDVLFFSGKESEKVKNKAVKDFNSDTSGKNIMVIQEASGKEGISLHDTTGEHQRVLVTLALPQSPITALQIEGRIYRIGNKSNAIFEYPLLGLNAEMMLFGQKFNQQVSTTENLALGLQARNLRESFARGVEEHSGDVDIDGQGVGGKELDAPGVTETDAFDRAVLDYYTNQKLTGRRDSRAGQDYYPTPEPLGYMMNQWGWIEEGDSVLEPSAGHGAIARYVPRENPLTAVEPSQSLFSKLQIKAGGNGRKFENDVFENYNVVNKHDVVLMNPPFGTGGRMAVDHVSKAFQHLEEGGRIVAIIPRGSTDKKFDKWYGEQKDAVLTAEIGLPDITFERAGTSVNCRVVVIDKVTNKSLRSDAASRAVHLDLSSMHFDKIEDFFEEIRDIRVPERTIDYKAKMKKKAASVARELRGMKGVRKVDLNEDRIFVDGRGVWASLQWGDWQGDALIKHLSEEYVRFRKSEEYAIDRDNKVQTEVYGELKELCCKLAGMTEDEMQRYVDRSGKDEGLRFREDDEEESDKKTPFTDQPNRANEKPVSGSVPASIHRDSSSNPMASKQADAKIDKDTQSTKSKLRKFFNGDYHVDSSSLNKTFVDLGKMLSMQDKGGSRYSVLRTNAGDTVAIRLSDHLANGNNFKRDNADSNLSIVIERHVYGTQGESDIEYTEAVIKQETFNQKPEEVIKAIVNGVNNVLEGKEFSLDPSIGEVRSEMSLLNREGEGTYTDKELSYLNDPISIFMGKNRFPKKRQESYAGKVRVRMKERANGLAELLNLDNVEILEDTEGLKGRKARAKGWFDPKTGKIVVVVSNHKSTYDIQQTVLHEAVAHYGLRKLFGKHFNDFLDNVYNNASAEIRGRIAQRAVEKKWDIREATEEYLADLAEHTNFENAQSEGWFQQIKNFFIRMLAKAGIRLDAELTDNELRYILWRSFDNLTNPGGRRSIIDEAKDIATQYELGVGNYEGSESSRNRVAKTLFRDGEDGSIRAYEESLKGVRYKFQEAYQDSMLALKHLQEVVAKTSGKPIQAFEDAYMAENHLSSKNTAEARKYYEAYFEPLEKEIAKITKGDTKGYEELSDYLILKHGVERNIEYSMRAFFRGLEGKMEEEEIEQYYSDYQSAKNALRKNVEDGTISEADYLQELEAIALEYVDTIDDYSGTRALLGRMAEAKMPNDVAEKDKTAHYLDKFNSVYGKEVNMQELARKAIAEYEGTHNVSSLWEKVNKATKYGLRKAYDSGMMSRDSYHHVDGMFRYYVPLRGWDEKTADDVYEYLGSEISPVNSVLKTAKGRKSIPDNPLPVIGNMAESAIIQGNRNMMKQSFLNMVQNHPTDVATLKKAWYVLDEVTGEWYVSYPDIEAHDTADDIADKVRDHELRMEELESKGLATQKRGKLNINYRINKGQAKEHVVNVKRNGQDYVIYVNGNPRAAQAVNGMTNPDAVTSKTLQAWNAANRWLAANFTTRNPAFVLSNISRDLIFAQSAVMVKESPEYAGKFFVNAGKAMSVVMRNINGKGSESNEMDRYFREFVENGGETGYMHLTDVDQYRKKIKRDLERLSGKEVKAKAAARYCIDRLEDFNRWAEDVSRFAAYATSRQMGRSIQESVRDAKEVTVNFNKKGAGFKTGGFIGYSAGVMHGLYLFFKVGIQSLVNFGWLAMKNPGKMGAMLGSFAATGVLVPAVINPMLYALLGGAGDDDPYKNLSEWERRNNLCIYCGGGGFIKIPLPIELRAFYGLGEMSYDYMTRKTRVRPEEVAFALANQITELLPLNPLGNNGDIVATLWPDVFQPFYEVIIQNKDYAGRPVYKETPFNELDPEFKRTYKGTSGWLVDVSQYLNEATRGNDFKKGEVDFNPAKIEHIYEYYLGGMGKTINQLGKTLWYGAKSIANGEKDENLVLRNVPVVNRFLSFPDEKNANAGINKEYFRMVDEWETLDHELNELAKKGALMNPKYLQQYIDLTNSDQYKWYKAFESFKKSLDGLYQMRKAIPDEEMQKQVDEQMMVLKRQAIDEMEKFSK